MPLLVVRTAQAVQLVKQGAAAGAKDKHGRLPLHYAASHGHHEVGCPSGRMLAGPPHASHDLTRVHVTQHARRGLAGTQVSCPLLPCR